MIAQWLKQGWSSTLRQFAVIITLFIYQLIWGLLLYRFIESIIYPLLRRYPGKAMSESAVQLFFAEGQFQLMKTDISYSYIAILAALFLVRFIVSPLIQAGLCHSIHYVDVREKHKFWRGVKQWGSYFILLYVIEMALAILPGVWLLPQLLSVYDHNFTMKSILLHASPWMLCWLLYAFILHLVFTSLQIGKVSERSALHSLRIAGRHLLPMFGLSGIVLAIGGVLSLVTVTVSMVWAGLFALILHQIYHLVRTLIKVWGFASQYHLWHTKSTP